MPFLRGSGRNGERRGQSPASRHGSSRHPAKDSRSHSKYQAPECEGTKITSHAGFCTNPVKSIASKPGVTVLELRRRGGVPDLLESLGQLCENYGVTPELIAQSVDAVYLAVKSQDRFDHLQMKLDACVEVRVRTGQCLITLIGEGAQKPSITARAIGALENPDAIVVNDTRSPLAMTILSSATRLASERRKTALRTVQTRR